MNATSVSYRFLSCPSHIKNTLVQVRASASNRIEKLNVAQESLQLLPEESSEGESMTREARMISGIILITVPTIQYGGYFLLTSLMNKGSGYMENPLRQNFFRAGHAHAGVIVILSLVCQMLADAAVLPTPLLWFVRIGIPLSAILISMGFFFSVLPPTTTQASGAVVLIYVGALTLACAVVSLGVGLLRAPQLT
jgi:hypothetical protein